MKAGRGRYRATLASPPFRRLFLSQLCSEFGDFAGRIALAVLVTDQTGSPLGAGAVLAVSAVPYFGLGQFLTGWSARFDARRVLVACDVLRAGLFIAIALDMPIWGRFVLLFLASTAAPVFEAVRNGLTPLTVPGAQLLDAIGIETLTNEVARIVGLAAGGFVASTVSPSVTLVANALSFVVSAWLLVGLPTFRPPEDLRSIRTGEGWRALAGDPISRRILWLFPCMVAFGSIPEALVVPFADEELPDTRALSGILAAVVSVSIVLTIPLLRQHSSHRDRINQTATLALIGSGLAVVCFALPSTIGTAVAGYFVVGVVFAGRVNTGSAISERIPDHLRASSFSVLDGVTSAGQLVAGLGGGLLAEAIGVREAFVAAMALSMAVGIVARLLPLDRARPAHARRPTA